MYDAVYKLSLFFPNIELMSEQTMTIFFFKYVEFQYRVLKLLTEIKETVKANHNAAFRPDCICFEKFDDIEKFLEFDDELKKNEEKFRELVSVAQTCSVKKVFLVISQNSLENTCARVSFLIKLQGSAFNFIRKETLA